MINKLSFSLLLSEWYSLNSKLILDESLSENDRRQLMFERKIYSAFFDIVEGKDNDKRN